MAANEMPSSRPQIFAFASNEWDTPWWMARQHLYTRLAARGWPVVYSTGAQSLWERSKSKWTNGPWWHGVEQVSGPDSAPLLIDRPGRLLPTWPKSETWSDFAVRRHARHLLRYAIADRPRIAYIWHPAFWPYVALLKADYVVFHMHDAYDLQKWTDADQRHMEQVVARADLIIAVAQTMARRLPADGPKKARILPHGVDYDAVQAGSESGCPADLASIPNPRIGYIGRINLKVDLSSLLAVAEQRPDWHWVLIGAVGVGSTGTFGTNEEAISQWRLIEERPNIHVLGPRPHDQLAPYLNNMDVLTMIYREDGGSWVAGYPTKIHEYLATGKPIVGANLETIRQFTDVVRIASTSAEWVAAIEDALRTGGQGTPDVRKAIARKGDWNKRTDVLEEWLLEMVSR